MQDFLGMGCVVEKPIGDLETRNFRFINCSFSLNYNLYLCACNYYWADEDTDLETLKVFGSDL